MCVCMKAGRGMRTGSQGECHEEGEDHWLSLICWLAIDDMLAPVLVVNAMKKLKIISAVKHRFST